MVKIRRPTQAGAFYEGNAESLRKQIEQCFLHKYGPGKLPKVDGAGPRQIVGLVCPHAGYMFSGPVAAHAYYKLALDGKPDIVVLFGPNHTGYGSALAVMNDGVWRTPLGDVGVDGETANSIVHESRIIDVDDSAHQFEHSIEVQLPFLQYLYGSNFKIVPVCFLMQDLSSAREVGQAVAKVLAEKNAVVIASSDMTHYEQQEKAAKNDRLALEAVEAMDETKFYSIIEAHNISACGYGPISALITAAKTLGAKEAKLLCYKTSGDIIGDYSSVVGYAAVSFTK
ncbi:MAG: AmmeMemoRadiSam system protein B [Candidatus Bathyarchaeota archaeon]|jgi:AmmeMemoRadiSam system protein B|nr:AmmeMemoRadiSam system protein B [Candidatus Bathyarchaeota archaeon A05DMB-5]MDH7557002.1 AmmeMemoRadiSam system protein B [Candidatus Bathyarchaeota archaeon]